MTGYVRQAIPEILNGMEVTAPPLNKEFNAIAQAFKGIGGHIHDGTEGNGPKLDLATSTEGFLPTDRGGIAGKHNLSATANPGATNDYSQEYAIGSLWLNTVTERVYVCLSSALDAAVWAEVAMVRGGFLPGITAEVDLGSTDKKFRDLFLSRLLSVGGNAEISGNATVGGTLGVTGDVSTDGKVTAAQGFEGDLEGSVTGNVTAQSGTSQFYSITVDGTASFGGTRLKNVATPDADTDAATKAYVDGSIIDLLHNSGQTLSNINVLSADNTLQTLRDLHDNLGDGNPLKQEVVAFSILFGS